MGECDCFYGHECNYYCQEGKHSDLAYANREGLMSSTFWNTESRRACRAKDQCTCEILHVKEVGETQTLEDRYGRKEDLSFPYLITFTKE